ncbi:putative endochitinase 1 [Phaeomoniella chlamydospora]|uniref:chitinase n=1 Tax=Phaeomoniella chlamydospora TaxID=158046 RepID=A0A0G2DZF2_PHACM|nr:putative endochitinase 1 [Phaeomoniella chlamydospora]
MHSNTGYRSVAYFVNWAIYGRNHNPQDLPVEKLTHINYAFANIRPDSGEVYLSDPWSDTDKHYPSDSWNDQGRNLYGCFKQLYLLKIRNRHLKVMLAIGGWTYSSNFAQPASTPQGRAHFAETAVKLLEDLGLDGIDLDWEYPKDQGQVEDYIRLLAAIRAELDSASHRRSRPCHFELAIACPAGPSEYKKLDLRAMDRYLDFWDLMAYDFAGSWDPIVGHQANLHPSELRPNSTPFSASAAVHWYTSHGIRPSKINLGMPLYGRAFTNTDGPGHSYSGIGEGSWEQGVWDYKALPRPGAKEHHELGDRGGCCASWSYDPAQRVLVSYDTPNITAGKARYVRHHGLGGGMWWESSCDKGDKSAAMEEGSLIGTFVNGLGDIGLSRTHNCLEYPFSKYDNLRNGMHGE